MKLVLGLLLGCLCTVAVFADNITGSVGADGAIVLRKVPPKFYRLVLEGKSAVGTDPRSIVINCAYGGRIVPLAPTGKWEEVVEFAASGEFCDTIRIFARFKGVELKKATLIPQDELVARHQHYIAKAEPNLDRDPDINPPTFRWPPLSMARTYTVLYKPVDRPWSEAQKKEIRTNPKFQELFFRPDNPLSPGKWEWKLVLNGQKEYGPYPFTVSAEATRWPVAPIAELKKNFAGKHPRLLCNDADFEKIRQNATGKMKPYADRMIRELEARKGESSPMNGLTSIRVLSRPIHEYMILGKALNRPDFIEEGKRRALILLRESPDLKINVDFAIGSVLEAAGFAYDYAYDILTDEERKVIRQEIVRRLEGKKYLTSLPRYLFDTHAWQFVFHQATAAAMAIWDEEPYAELFVESAAKMYVALYPWFGAGDGGSAEGVHYALETNTIPGFIARELWMHFCKLDLAGNPWMKRNIDLVLYGYPNRVKSVWHSDNGDNPAGEYGIIAAPLYAALYDSIYDDVQARNYAAKYLDLNASEHLYRGILLQIMPLIKGPFASTVTPAAPLPFAVNMADSGVVYANTDFDQADNNITFEMRSSPFGSFGHAHADQNSFNIFAFGEKVVLDSGYYIIFGDEHHVEYAMQSVAHNTVLVNGVGQARRSVLGPGRIADFAQQGGVLYVKGDAAKAYPATELARFDREFLFYKTAGGANLVIYDDLELRGADLSVWNWLLHLEAKPVIRGNQLVAKYDKSTLQVDWLLPEKLNFHVKDQFPVAPVFAPSRKAHFQHVKPQWHVDATTEKSHRQKFVTVLQIRKNTSGVKAEDVRLIDNELRVGSDRIVKTDQAITLYQKDRQTTLPLKP